MEEFNLSNKEEYIDEDGRNDEIASTKVYLKRDVKEFIKRLKAELKTDLTGCFNSQKQCDEWNKDTNEIIDKLAGDKLI